MKESRRVALVTFLMTALLVVVCVIRLPETVQVINSLRAMTAIYLPKLWAIGLPAGFSLAGIIGVLVSKKERAPEKYKTLMISIIAILFLGYMIIAN